MPKYTAKYLCNMPIDFCGRRRLDGLRAPYLCYNYVTILWHLCYNSVTILRCPIIGTRQPGRSPENFTTFSSKSQPPKILHFAQNSKSFFVHLHKKNKCSNLMSEVQLKGHQKRVSILENYTIPSPGSQVLFEKIFAQIFW